MHQRNKFLIGVGLLAFQLALLPISAQQVRERVIHILSEAIILLYPELIPFNNSLRRSHLNILSKELLQMLKEIRSLEQAFLRRVHIMAL